MKQCKGCTLKKPCEDTFVSWLFFLVGLIATVAIRVVTVLDAYRPIYGKIAWYVGVVGFFLFFIYKFKVDSLRLGIIRQARLAEKMHNKTELKKEDYQLMHYILCSFSTKKELANYFFIFATSIIAFIVALYLDVFKS